MVLATPQAVIDAAVGIKDGGSYGKVNYDGWRFEFAQQGFRDGQKFDPATTLPEGYR
ncbi:MAG: hypothetical protein FWG36_00630 [Oscillospiraceae bacterium]|nr:hypothetical protein [Oscillospiraceae bacterium]